MAQVTIFRWEILRVTSHPGQLSLVSLVGWVAAASARPHANHLYRGIFQAPAPHNSIIYGPDAPLMPGQHCLLKALKAPSIR